MASVIFQICFIIFKVSVSLGFGSLQIYWNVPSQMCFDKNINIPLDKYPILYNKGHKLEGEKIVTFYETKFGLYPYFDNGVAINGGLPQRCNMKAHLAKAQKDIIKAIPDEGFDGIAVLDFEQWRPLFHLNWESKTIYQSKSIELVKKDYPTISNKGAHKAAMDDFNNASRQFFVETIKMARKLRPVADWGFYGFPMCNYDAGMKGETSCSDKFKKYNDELEFVHSAGTALFPSIYLDTDDYPEVNYKYVHAVLEETKRIASEQEQTISYFPYKRDMPIYPFTKFEYDPYERPGWFYTKADYCNTIKQAADLGVNGLLLWSTSQNMAARCQKIAHEMRAELGTALDIVKNLTDSCQEDRCRGEEKCVLRKMQKRCSFQMKTDDYKCG